MARSYQKIDDHYTFAEETRLPTQFFDKTVFNALLKSFLGSSQSLEDAAWEMYTERNLREGEGVILDEIGELLGIKRQGLSDTEYRELLVSETVQRETGGTATDIMDTAKALWQVIDTEVFSHESESYLGGGVVVRVSQPIDRFSGDIRDSINGPEVMNSVSPVSTGSVAILKDYDARCWIPAEVTGAYPNITADDDGASNKDLITELDESIIALADFKGGVVDFRDERGRLAEITLVRVDFQVEDENYDPHDFLVETREGFLKRSEQFEIEEEGFEDVYGMMCDVEQIHRENRVRN